MTREDEIKKIALCYAHDELKDSQSPIEDVVAAAFIDGALWADSHPKQIEISLEDIEEFAKEVIPKDWVERQETLWDMIRRNQRAQFITKACKWLKDYAHIYVSETTGDLDEDDLINDFRKDMKGE